MTTPPPTATTTSERLIPARAKSRQSASTTLNDLAASPSGTSNDGELASPGSTLTPMPAWVTTAALDAAAVTSATRSASWWRTPSPTITS